MLQIVPMLESLERWEVWNVGMLESLERWNVGTLERVARATAKEQWGSTERVPLPPAEAPATQPYDPALQKYIPFIEVHGSLSTRHLEGPTDTKPETAELPANKLCAGNHELYRLQGP